MPEGAYVYTHTHTHTHGQHLKLTADVVLGFSINFQPLLSKKLLLLNWINITLSFIVNTPAGKSLPRAPTSAVFKLRCWLSWSGSPTSPVTARNRAPSSLDKTSKALQESIQRPDQTGAPCQLCAPSEGLARRFGSPSSFQTRQGRHASSVPPVRARTVCHTYGITPTLGSSDMFGC